MQVIRCGNDLFPHLWCHHESVVCVDQEVRTLPTAPRLPRSQAGRRLYGCCMLLRTVGY